MQCGSTWLSSTLRWGYYSPDLFRDLRQRVVLQVAGVTVKFSDAFGQFLRRHRVFVVHPAESFLVQVDLFVLAGLRFRRIEFTPQPCAVMRTIKSIGYSGNHSE